jgi:malonyl-CoA O-methyltransferase
MRQAFAAAAASYDEAAVLAREVGRRMDERLDYVRIAPQRVADIGCASGDGIRDLSKRYPDALPLAIDYARPMLQAVAARSGFMQRLRRRAPRLLNADARALPLKNGSLDLAWSNLALHWLDDPLPAFREIHRTLAVEGLFTFSLLGPDTLKALRNICVDLGIPPPLRKFHDMHDIGDMLVAAGFADPVMDMEMIALTYTSPRGFLRDQRLLGVRDGLLGHLSWRDWRRVFAAWSAARQEGRIHAQFEIVYGHAWKAAAKQTDDGRAIMQFHPKQ